MTLSSAEVTAHHRLNKKQMERVAARQPAPKPWKMRRSDVQMIQNDRGEWFIAQESGSLILATDFEVSLWLELQEIKAKLEATCQATQS